MTPTAFYIAHHLPRILVLAFYALGVVVALRRLLSRDGEPPGVVKLGAAAVVAIASQVGLPYWVFHPLSLDWKYKPLWPLSALAAAGTILFIGYWLVALARYFGKLPASQPRPRGSDAVATTPADKNLARRKFFVETARMAGSVGGGAALAYGLYEHRALQVSRVTVPLPWPTAWYGMRLLHISDLHIHTESDLKFLEKVVARANEEKADFAFLTGDISAMTGPIVEQACAILADLNVKYGRYACLGNHDYYGDWQFIENELARVLWPVLRNGSTRAFIPGGAIYIAGITDPYAPRFHAEGPDLVKALRGIEPNMPTVLLSHQPNYFDQAAQLGVNLTLSGHTHGGQIALGPWLNPGRALSRYVYGLHKQGKSYLYVTSGVGTVGVPLRINAPPEIAIITVNA